MNVTFLPIWIVDVGGSVLMIVLAFVCVRYVRRLRRRDTENIVWAYMLWVCLALALFAVSRSVGHIVKQMLIISGHQATWALIKPYSGAINSFAFVMVGAVTLFFERTWTLYESIVQGRAALEVAHGELSHLNQNLERLVDERSKALARSEHKYQRIFQESKDMLLVTDRQGRIQDLNPAGRMLLGLEAIGSRNPSAVCFAEFLSLEDWQTITRSIAAQGFISSAEMDLKTGDGGRRRVLLSGGLVAGEGEPDTLHFLVKDIEQQHIAREQMAQADKLASIGAFSSGIAHEINNPLGIILGYTQLMLRNEEKASARAADLKTIEKQVRHCKSIVEDLLNFARTSAPKKELCDVHAVIEDVLHFFRQHAKLESIRIDTNYDGRICRLLLDEKKIKQVLLNLLMNAHYAVGREGAIATATELLPNGQQACIKVRDSGPGIEPKNLSRIFDPFFTTKPTGQGTGLGLSVSYGIIKNHGGEIWAESIPGQGATFIIVLPLPADQRGR
ncbi:MAG: PAS domain S-box protein [Desulfobacterales bacterium]|nr:PAS domain S-box protein [Desulfobacterales bacterium]